MSEALLERPRWRPALVALASLLVTATVVWALVEIIRIDFRRQSHLVNVSCRGPVGPDGQALVAGFVIAQHSQLMVVRALGPSLALQNVHPALSSPRLRIVRNQDGVEMARNEGWRLSPEARRLTTDLMPFAPADPRESVCVVTLPAGTYSAVVESRDGGSGIAMIEIYAVID